MRFLCPDVPIPDVNPEKFQPHLREEVRHAWQLYKADFVRNIYFRQDRPGVAIIAECDSLDAARQALAEFPFAKLGFIDWDNIPLGPFLGWESLLAADHV